MAKHARFKPRRWPIFVITALLVAIIVSAFVYVEKEKIDLQPMDEVPTVPTQIIAEQPTIKPSRVTQIFVPATEPSYVINNGVTELNSCMPQIDPPLDGKGIGSVYECMDFARPGTSSQGLSILAGHSSCRVDTVFNRLNEQGDTLIGREVLLKTETSGNKWLVYQINAAYKPDKNELPYMEEIWGNSETPLGLAY